MGYEREKLNETHSYVGSEYPRITPHELMRAERRMKDILAVLAAKETYGLELEKSRRIGRESLRGVKPSKLLVDSLIVWFCLENDVRPNEIRAGVRTNRVSRIRWALAAHLRMLGYSLCPIGQALGMDHTSVIYGVERHNGKPSHYRSHKPLGGPRTPLPKDTGIQNLMND